jgi:hypothetical protein
MRYTPTEDEIAKVEADYGFDYLQARNHLIGRAHAQAHAAEQQEARRRRAEDQAFAAARFLRQCEGAQP